MFLKLVTFHVVQGLKFLTFFTRSLTVEEKSENIQ